MRIGIIADIHANLIALEAVMERLNSCDQILCAGDVVGYYPYFNEVIELLRKERVQSVLGNHDYAIITGETSNLDTYGRISAVYTRKNLDERNREWLESLPYRIETEHFNVYHGAPAKSLESLFIYLFPTFPLIGKILEEEGVNVVVGHTHIQFERKHPKLGLKLLNPGSVGQPRDGDNRAAYAIFDSENASFHFDRAEYRIEEVFMAVKRFGLPIVQGLRLFRGY
jgi:putative phosphoesterase